MADYARGGTDVQIGQQYSTAEAVRRSKRPIQGRLQRLQYASGRVSTEQHVSKFVALKTVSVTPVQEMTTYTQCAIRNAGLSIARCRHMQPHHRCNGPIIRSCRSAGGRSHRKRRKGDASRYLGPFPVAHACQIISLRFLFRRQSIAGRHTFGAVSDATSISSCHPCW